VLSFASTLSPARESVDQLAGLGGALHGLQRDVDDVVGEPAAVREALQVAARTPSRFGTLAAARPG
jgi:hypothetical protein